MSGLSGFPSESELIAETDKIMRHFVPIGPDGCSFAQKSSFAGQQNGELLLAPLLQFRVILNPRPISYGRMSRRRLVCNHLKLAGSNIESLKYCGSMNVAFLR